ncbi:MAG: glutathione synthase [Desulfobacterales bacterium]|jgi:ribosomal protein S6--L-glutamate ligase|nr:glutathione synthase [Desulfobacterales bacterium]
MIVSFHPLFRGDRNILCASREPGPSDLSAILKASAVVLPQGCQRQLYFMARDNCPNVFPNYDARFRYPGKIGQIRLFMEKSISHPPTQVFQSLAEFKRRYPGSGSPNLPLVFKFDWGGEGETVFFARSLIELDQLLDRTACYEASGQFGFLLQKHIPSGNRSLRVVVIGDRILSYWRICEERNVFQTVNLSKGAKLDSVGDTGLKRKAENMVSDFCRCTGINLAGFDLIFAEDGSTPRPLLLEINYFFGRVGLGGSEHYYRMLKKAIKRWLKAIDV